MKKIFLVFIPLYFAYAHEANSTLTQSFPDAITHVANNKVYFKDNSFLIYDDNITNKDFLNNADIEDMVSKPYPFLKPINLNPKDDIGRYRNEAFFKKLYGKNKQEVMKNLVTVSWLPTHTKTKLLFNKNHGAAKALQEISNELDLLDKKYLKYLLNPAGTFRYRKIKNTNRLSPHSFGIAIDLNVKFSNYWLWNKNLKYTNKIPKEIVYIFEKHGFIWGGRWKHFDTMHFEYRPELGGI